MIIFDNGKTLDSIFLKLISDVFFIIFLTPHSLTTVFAGSTHDYCNSFFTILFLRILQNVNLITFLNSLILIIVLIHMLTTLHVDFDVAATTKPIAWVRLWARVSDDLGAIKVFVLLVLLGFALMNM